MKRKKKKKMNKGTQADTSTGHRFSKDRPRFNDTLDVIKFLCKDLWTLVFRKQVDNLKTNHRVCYSKWPFTPDLDAKTCLGSGSLRPHR